MTCKKQIPAALPEPGRAFLQAAAVFICEYFLVIFRHTRFIHPANYSVNTGICPGASGINLITEIISVG